jgi:hypothetical protein
MSGGYRSHIVDAWVTENCRRGLPSNVETRRPARGPRHRASTIPGCIRLTAPSYIRRLGDERSENGECAILRPLTFFTLDRLPSFGMGSAPFSTSTCTQLAQHTQARIPNRYDSVTEEFGACRADVISTPHDSMRYHDHGRRRGSVMR